MGVITDHLRGNWVIKLNFVKQGDSVTRLDPTIVLTVAVQILV